MKFSTAALSATLAAFATGASAQLSVLVPGGSDLWWVAASDNVVSWTCKTSPFTNFTVLIANSDPNILVQPQAFIAQQNNFDCSKLITKDQINLNPGTGYTIQLANPFNETDVYASSQPFEIKPLGSAYPASSATPTGASETGSATGSGSSSTSSATGAAQSDTTSSGAFGLSAPSALTAAAFAVVGLMFA